MTSTTTPTSQLINLQDTAMFGMGIWWMNNLTQYNSPRQLLKPGANMAHYHNSDFLECSQTPVSAPNSMGQQEKLFCLGSIKGNFNLPYLSSSGGGRIPSRDLKKGGTIKNYKNKIFPLVYSSHSLLKFEDNLIGSPSASMTGTNIAINPFKIDVPWETFSNYFESYRGAGDDVLEDLSSKGISEASINSVLWTPYFYPKDSTYEDWDETVKTKYWGRNINFDGMMKNQSQNNPITLVNSLWNSLVWWNYNSSMTSYIQPSSQYSSENFQIYFDTSDVSSENITFTPQSQDAKSLWNVVHEMPGLPDPSLPGPSLTESYGTQTFIYDPITGHSGSITVDKGVETSITKTHGTSAGTSSTAGAKFGVSFTNTDSVTEGGIGESLSETLSTEISDSFSESKGVNFSSSSLDGQSTYTTGSVGWNICDQGACPSYVEQDGCPVINKTTGQARIANYYIVDSMVDNKMEKLKVGFVQGEEYIAVMGNWNQNVSSVYTGKYYIDGSIGSFKSVNITATEGDGVSQAVDLPLNESILKYSNVYGYPHVAGYDASLFGEYIPEKGIDFTGTATGSTKGATTSTTLYLQKCSSISRTIDGEIQITPICATPEQLTSWGIPAADMQGDSDDLGDAADSAGMTVDGDYPQCNSENVGGLADSADTTTDPGDVADSADTTTDSGDLADSADTTTDSGGLADSADTTTDSGDIADSADTTTDSGDTQSDSSNSPNRPLTRNGSKTRATNINLKEYDVHVKDNIGLYHIFPEESRGRKSISGSGSRDAVYASKKGTHTFRSFKGSYLHGHKNKDNFLFKRNHSGNTVYANAGDDKIKTAATVSADLGSGNDLFKIKANVRPGSVHSVLTGDGHDKIIINSSEAEFRIGDFNPLYDQIIVGGALKPELLKGELVSLADELDLIDASRIEFKYNDQYVGTAHITSDPVFASKISNRNFLIEIAALNRDYRGNQPVSKILHSDSDRHTRFDILSDMIENGLAHSKTITHEDWKSFDNEKRSSLMHESGLAFGLNISKKDWRNFLGASENSDEFSLLDMNGISQFSA